MILTVKKRNLKQIHRSAQRESNIRSIFKVFTFSYLLIRHIFYKHIQENTALCSSSKTHCYPFLTLVDSRLVIIPAYLHSSREAILNSMATLYGLHQGSIRFSIQNCFSSSLFASHSQRTQFVLFNPYLMGGEEMDSYVDNGIYVEVKTEFELDLSFSCPEVPTITRTARSFHIIIWKYFSTRFFWI